MTNQRAFVALAADTIGADNRQWIEIMPTTGSGENGGKKFVLTAADLEVYAAWIREHAGQTPLDYDHEGALSGGSTKASGWFTGEAEIRETDARGPILNAEVQWTPSAAQAIRDGEYRFISAEFSFHDRDEKTGLLTRAKELIAATLTNRPFFTELAPVAAVLSDAHADAIATALGVDRERVVAAAATADEAATAATTPKEGTMADTATTEISQALREKLGLADDATEADALAKLDELNAKGDTGTGDDGEKQLEIVDNQKPEQLPVAASGVTVDPETWEQTKKDAADGRLARAEQVRSSREQFVDTAVKAGKFPPSRRDHYLALMERDDQGTRDFVDGLAANAIPVEQRGAAPSDQGGDKAEMDVIMASFGYGPRAGKGN